MKNKLTIIALFGVFLLPILLSWGLYYAGDVEGGKRNNGTLIQPPRTLQELELFDPVKNTTGPLYGKWTLVMFHNGACEEACEEKLYKSRQIRLAMNKYAHRLQRLLITDLAALDLTNVIDPEYSGQLILPGDDMSQEDLARFELNPGESPFDSNRIFVIDPIGNIMMYYSQDDDPLGIIEDLLLLIKISRIG